MNWISVSLLAASLGVGQKEITAGALARFESMVSGWGYQFKSPDYVLRKGKSEVDFEVWFGYEKTDSPYVSKLKLKKRFTIPAGIDENTVKAKANYYDPDRVWSYRIHLDRTVEIREDVDFDPKGQSAEAHDKLDTFWNHIEQFQLWIANPPGKDKSLRKPVAVEDRLVKGLDQQDVSFLIHRWGWDYHQGFGYSSPVWLLPATVDGANIIFRGPFLPTTPISQVDPDKWFEVTGSFPIPKGIHIEHIQDELGPSEKWAKFSQANSPETAQAMITVDFGPGMTIGQVKERVLDFAHHLKAIADKR